MIIFLVVRSGFRSWVLFGTEHQAESEHCTRTPGKLASSRLGDSSGDLDGGHGEARVNCSADTAGM